MHVHSAMNGATIRLMSQGKNGIFQMMNRKHTAIFRISDRRDEDFVPGTPADRISLVWPLTREIASLSKKHDAERRLQRHVTSLVRGKG